MQVLEGTYNLEKGGRGGIGGRQPRETTATGKASLVLAEIIP